MKFFENVNEKNEKGIKKIKKQKKKKKKKYMINGKSTNYFVKMLKIFGVFLMISVEIAEFANDLIKIIDFYIHLCRQLWKLHRWKNRKGVQFPT